MNGLPAPVSNYMGLFYWLKMNIDLGEGLFAIIDDSDFEVVRRHNWVAKIEGRNTYAVTGRRFKRMHRVILNAKPDQIIDHKNGNGLDNRRENLRFCNAHQNQGNRKFTLNSPVPFKGVSWKKEKSKFLAKISNNNKAIFLGYFDCPFKAARAYDAKAKEIFGEFAKLNFKEK